MTFSNFFEHTSPLFAFLKILKVTDVFKFQTLKLGFNFYNGSLPIQIKNLFVKITICIITIQEVHNF